MAKWQFSYVRFDGYRGHFKVAAASKHEAIQKGMQRAMKAGEPIVHWDCKLAQPA